MARQLPISNMSTAVGAKPVGDAERRLGEILESAPDAILQIDNGGRIVLLNRMAEQMFGYSRQELLGQSVESLVAEASREAHKEHRKRYFNQPVTRPMGSGPKLKGRRKNGSQFPVEISLSAVTSSTESFVTAIIRDITQREELEKRQRKDEQQFRLMIERVVDYAIFTLDLEGTVISWNAGAQRLNQYTADEIIGRRFSIFYPPEERNTKPAKVLETVRVIGKFEEEGWRVRKDGSKFWANVVITAVHDQAGDVVGYLKLVRDLTERKQAEDLLRRANDDLTHFAYTASHDLHEPLRTITLYTQLLARECKGKLGKQAEQFSRLAVEGALRMADLLNGIREYWLASGRSEEHHAAVPSSEALKKALLNLQESIINSGAVVTHESLPVVGAEEVLLVQLFQNLVGNAIKYRGESPPAVHVTAEKYDSRQWVFSVKDNGMGIDPCYAEQIFAVFNRLHGHDHPGAGIGLAICRKVVERLGGSIWVESTPGCGANFKFTIPIET